MNITTFEEDLIGLKDFATRLESFIEIERRYIDGGLVVGLSSKFGSGKSTFFQMWKSSLTEDKKEDAPLVILLNAWESDYYGDPLFAIVSALVDCIKHRGKSVKKIVDAAKDLGWFSTAVSGQIVKKFTGVDAVAAGDYAEKKKKGRDQTQQILHDSFSVFEARKNAMHSLRKAIMEFTEKNQPTILFLVDELDRCRPDYAISYLETIKHIFDIKGTVFILAADRQHLENSAKTAFGAKLDFDEYYRKFVHREVTLPDISESSYNKIASKYVSFYLEGDGSRNCLMELDRHRVDNIVKLVGNLGLTPRQIQEVFRVLGHIFETTQDLKGRLLWCLAVGSILMIVLKIADSRIYKLLGSQECPPQEALDLFKDRIKDSHIDWWFTLCFSGGGLKTEENESLEVLMRRVGLIDKDDQTNHSRDLGQWFSGWGHSSNGFEQIYEKIEQLDKWK